MRVSLLALALITAAEPAYAQPVIQAVPERPRIIVDGYGEIRTAPDLAIISYTVRGEGSTSDEAVRAMTTSGARIGASLLRLDPTGLPKTNEVRVTPVKSDSCKEQEDNALQLSKGPCAVLGYVATQAITLRTNDVKDSGTMVGLIGRNGGFDGRINNFDLSDPRSAQQRATAAALTDAATKAAAIAAASRVSLGTVLSINTSGRQDGEVIAVTAMRKPVAEMDMVAAPPPVPVSVTPEPITTSANVTITYAIGQ